MGGLGVIALACTACSSPSSGTHEPDASTQPDAPAAQPDAPVSPSQLPIKHVVVIIKENHTFDNYFGSFPNAEGISVITTPSGPISPPHAPDRTPRDLCHAHDCALMDYAGNWLDVTGASNNGDNLVYSQYVESDIPNYWAYART